MSVLHRPALSAWYKLPIMLPLLPHIANSKAIISYKVDFFEYFETLVTVGDEDKSNQLSVPSGTVTDILVRVIEPLSHLNENSKYLPICLTTFTIVILFF